MTSAPARPPELDRALRALVGEAFAEYGDLGAETERLVDELHSRLIARAEAAGEEPTPELVESLVGRTHGVDLVLAIAWQLGSELAWARYAELFEDTVRKAAVAQGADDERARALAAALPGELFGPHSDLARYQGRGALAGWLTVRVRRRVIDEARRPRTEALSPAHERADEAHDASSGVLADETRTRLRDALTPLAEELTDREATALLLKHRHGMPQRSIARALGISDSRVTRLVQSAFDKLGTRLRSAFPDGRPTGFPGMDFVWRELDSLRNEGQTSLTPSDSSSAEPAGT